MARSSAEATFTASHVGIGLARNSNLFTCTRCGGERKVNSRRRKKPDEDNFVAIDRATYKCYDCKWVEALEEAEDEQEAEAG